MDTILGFFINAVIACTTPNGLVFPDSLTLWTTDEREFVENADNVIRVAQMIPFVTNGACKVGAVGGAYEIFDPLHPNQGQ